MGILASIYEDKEIGNCSAGGISSKASTVCVVNIDGPFEPNEKHPGVEIIAHPAGLDYGPIAVPVDKPEGCVGPMAGGAYIGTSDSRFSAKMKSLGAGYADIVRLHDRFETPELYEKMSH